MRVAGAAGASAALCLLVLVNPALGAVRLCKPAVASAVRSAASEMEAKKQALDDWKAKASVYGEAYASWRLAAEKTLVCKPTSDGNVACIARAVPCTIEQAPSRRGVREKRLET